MNTSYAFQSACLKIAMAAAILAVALVIAFNHQGCAGTGQVKGWNPDRDLVILNSWGKPARQIEVGQTLNIGLTNLEPNRSYRVQLLDDDARLVSYYQLTSNRQGVIEPTPLWFHSGVVGCGGLGRQIKDRYRFRSFEEAQAALANRTFRLNVIDSAGRSLAKKSIPVTGSAEKVQPLVHFSNAEGCLMNGFIAGKDDVYLSGKALPDGAEISVFLVRNRYGWRPGMPLEEIRAKYREQPQTIHLRSGQSSFRELIWQARDIGAGAYDAVLRINNREFKRELLADDLVLYFQDTGAIILFAYSPPWAPNDFDIAGRLDKNFGYPYFAFHDVFALHEEMWGAVDPAALPAVHPGGNYAAFHVINHGSAGSGLTDVTEALEIVPVKGGCINGSMTRIWNDPPNTGEYDVVVDFGATVAGTAGAWMADSTFNSGTDFIDRSSTVGAFVVNDPSLAGPPPVLSWEYAPDPANASDPLWTDVSSYFNSPDFSVPYTMDHVPLHGIVRYPSGAGPFPLVLIVHGNHDPSDPSEPGYFYLCDLLASHGMIAVTVDENFLNGSVGGEMDARAIVLLRHLQRWRTWNGTPAHTFFNKVDLSKIGLAGHSRGGEAICVAWRFNTTLHNAVDPNHDFNFGIESLFAIAPVDGQYLPLTVVEGVDYFVMHGTHDGDVSNFGGHKMFDRAHPVASAATASKSLLWVYGANHGQWNTGWLTCCETVVQPSADRISAADQQAIGKVYMSAFYRLTLKNEEPYRALFSGDLTFDSLPAPVTRVYQYQDKDRLFINHFEEDDDLATASFAGASNDNPGSVLNPYLDQDFSGGSSNPFWLWQQTDGLIAGWTATTGQFVINLPASIGTQVDTFPYLAFRVGQVYETTAVKKNVPGAIQDLSVQLELGPTIAHELKVSNFDSLPYPKEAMRGAANVTKTVMTTVRIPLRSFTVNRSDWDLHNLSRIRFKFNQKSTGLLAIDEIQLTK